MKSSFFLSKSSFIPQDKTSQCGETDCTVGDAFTEHIKSKSNIGLLTCGGGSTAEKTSCVTFDGHAAFNGGNWKKTHILSQYRTFHTSWASPKGVLLIGSSETNYQTSEMLIDDGDTTATFPLNNSR